MTFYRDLLAEVRSVTPKMSGSFQSLHLPGHIITIMLCQDITGLT